MQLQNLPNGCGAAALCNALEAIGYRLTLEAAAKLARTSADGTDSVHLKRAIRVLGFEPHEWQTANRQAAWAITVGYLNMGYPVLLCVDEEEHYVAAIGILGGLVVIVDSADGGVVQTLDRRHFLARLSSGGKVPTFSGMAVQRKE